jgi:hypothetical protein
MKYAIQLFSGIMTIGSGVRVILSRVTVTKDGIRIGNGFINNLQVVITICYHTIADLHTTKHYTVMFSVWLKLNSSLSG